MSKPHQSHACWHGDGMVSAGHVWWYARLRGDDRIAKKQYDSCMFIVLLIAAVLAALFVVLTLLVYLLLVVPTLSRRKEPAPEVFEDNVHLAPYLSEIRAAVDWFHSANPETLRITSFDAIPLAAWYVPAENARGTVICMHGYHGSPLGDFSLAAKFFHDHNWNVLLPHERAHGESGGRYLTFGVHERFDCRDWAKAIDEKNNSGLPIVLYGISMGCATVVMSSGLELPKNVACIIADCGYTSPFNEIAHVLKTSYHLPLFPIIYLSDMLARLIAGFSLKECSTLDVLKINKIPVLFIHGDADNFVPTYMSRQNYEACVAEKELLIVKDSPHAINYALDRKNYEQVMTAFIKKHAGIF